MRQARPRSRWKSSQKILRRSLCHAVDILGNGCDVLGYPHRGRSGRGRQSPAKCAGRAREDKGAGRRGFFEEIERARNVGIDEVLPAVSDHMGFMQARRMEDPFMHLFTQERSTIEPTLLVKFEATMSRPTTSWLV